MRITADGNKLRVEYKAQTMWVQDTDVEKFIRELLAAYADLRDTPFSVEASKDYTQALRDHKEWVKRQFEAFSNGDPEC